MNFNNLERIKMKQI